MGLKVRIASVVLLWSCTAACKPVENVVARLAEGPSCKEFTDAQRVLLADATADPFFEDWLWTDHKVAHTCLFNYQDTKATQVEIDERVKSLQARGFIVAKDEGDAWRATDEQAGIEVHGNAFPDYPDLVTFVWARELRSDHPKYSREVLAADALAHTFPAKFGEFLDAKIIDPEMVKVFYERRAELEAFEVRLTPREPEGTQKVVAWLEAAGVASRPFAGGDDAWNGVARGFSYTVDSVGRVALTFLR